MRITPAVKNHLVAIAIWLGIVAAVYVLTERMTAPPPVARSVAADKSEIVIPVARDGHYYLEGAVNGEPLRFLVDSGASLVSVGSGFAQAAKLAKGVTGYFNTANGMVEAEVVKNQTVRADVFEVSGLSVAVLPGQSEQGLLGQNFLRHFEVLQVRDTLVLRLRSKRSRLARQRMSQRVMLWHPGYESNVRPTP